MVITISALKQFASTGTGKAIAIGSGLAVAGGTTAGVIGAVRSRAKKSRKKVKKKTTKRKPARKKRKVKPKYARTAGKRRDTSTRRIRMTKNGQPYVILANGRARFISKKSAARSRKRKGGRY